MKKRFLLLALALLLSIPAQAVEPDSLASSDALSPMGATSPFVRVRSYDGGFTDVAAGAWYESAVASLYEYGLTEGIGGGCYAPDASVTLAELIAFSARLNAAYTGGTIREAKRGEAWYQPYADYLTDAGLLDGTFDLPLTSPATRAQAAGILGETLPGEWYDERNAAVVTDGYARREYITDVNDYTPYQMQILRLYKWGVVGGTDTKGSFQPDATLRRSEVAALLVRMLDPAARVTLNWSAMPYRSAVGTTFADLVTAPASVTTAPASGDDAAIDALVRRMLASDASTISLRYILAPNAEETAALARAFTTAIKRYCEQMYNTVTCRAYASGRVELAFSSTVCDDATLARRRTETMDTAISVHDALWESGYLDTSMSEYELARAYYIWLCSACVYDESAVTESAAAHLAYSALVDGTAVCDGYTGAYDLLLKLEGIECNALMNADHIWTVATLDGVCYHIDATWGDRGRNADLSFFGMSEAQSRALHPW